CLRRLGIVLLLFGAGLLFTAWKLVEARSGQPRATIVLLAVGTMALLGGGFCAFVRGGAFLDRREKVEVTWWRAAGLGRRKAMSFAGVDRVTIEKESGGSDSPTTYPVRLAGSAGIEALVLDKPSDYQQARATGEQVARFLDLPLHDHSAGIPVVRQPARLDEPLRSRLHRTGELPPLPSAPPDPRARVERTSDGLRIEIAGAGVSAVGWIPVGFAAVFSTIVGANLLPALLRGGWSPFLGLGLLFVLAPLLLTLKGAGSQVLRRTVIEANRLGLRVEMVHWLTRQRVAIPADELEELILPRLDAPGIPLGKETAEVWKWSLDRGRLPDGGAVPKPLNWLWRLAQTPGILARSDRVSVTLAAGLPPEELAYLHGMLVRALVQ
ncbi:MAG TPA: hypothetical protein PLS53_12695, partial [Thermoanaerobaculaceae bacterium]|nr:hypothetical protein [Thermoanaerobaculaceae bacterium]